MGNVAAEAWGGGGLSARAAAGLAPSALGELGFLPALSSERVASLREDFPFQRAASRLPDVLVLVSVP